MSTVLVGVGASAAFVLPAVWNGFPLVFHDSGGYFAAFMGRELGFGRSAAYGAFLAVGLPLAFWPAIVVQAFVTAWLILATLRAHGIVRPAVTAAVLVFLAAATSLPWYTAQLMPDLWAALAVLAIYLLAFRPPPRMAERLALVAVVAFAVAGHMATQGLTTGLIVVLAAARLAGGRLGIERPALAWPTAAVAAGLIAALASNYAIAGRFAFTPGGSNFLFARLVHTGIAARYLDDNCPDPSLELCKFRRALPTLGEDWLWEPDSPLNRDLGGWEVFAPEAERIVTESLVDYPLVHLGAALAGTAEQFVKFDTGDGLVSWTWSTHYEMERLAPQLLPVFKAARQQQDGFDLSAVNLLHLPVAFASLLGLGVVLVAARRLPAPTSTLAGFVLVALLGNAAICGALSIPNARYQSRVVWLAPFALAVAVAGLRRRSEATVPAQA
ncbi:hypothetical protein RA307_19030 [Xanthobacteraceae bacterium Astr-EGSB]|uniref:hypothetical protein n=1 Tax=Astrobacterium formosum TaxID=3069710 RepID=UPI0027ADEA4A|nr:hypothetical protein [Xanthobacteraceae bacterium Astr-EGSB]